MTKHLPWEYSAKNPPRAEQPAPRPQAQRRPLVAELSDALLLAQATRDAQANQRRLDAGTARSRPYSTAADTMHCDGGCGHVILPGARYVTLIVKGRTLYAHPLCSRILLARS